MPLMRCKTKGGAKGWKFGKSGHCFPTKKQAIQQMKAMYAGGYTGAGFKAAMSKEGLLNDEDAIEILNEIIMQEVEEKIRKGEFGE